MFDYNPTEQSYENCWTSGPRLKMYVERNFSQIGWGKRWMFQDESAESRCGVEWIPHSESEPQLYDSTRNTTAFQACEERLGKLQRLSRRSPYLDTKVDISRYSRHKLLLQFTQLYLRHFWPFEMKT